MKWEYKILPNDANTVEEANTWLNELGSEGWENYQVVIGAGDIDLYFFKRRKVEDCRIKTVDRETSVPKEQIQQAVREVFGKSEDPELDYNKAEE